MTFRSPYFIFGLLTLAIAFCVLFKVQKGSPLPHEGNDIYYIWSDGYEIAHGTNPYSKIHGSDMLRNNKYSTYLPGFFLVISAYVAAGFDTFDNWLSVWRPATWILHCALGLLIFSALYKKSGLLLALFGAHFWLLSRWPISVMNSGQIDILTMLILISSLLLLDSRKTLALILFGLSLSIKQIGIFMLPVFLLYNMDLKRPLADNAKKLVLDLCYISIIPLLTCLPFLIWDFTGFVKSILFSATRSPGGHIKVPGIDELLGIVGIVAKLPMFALMGLIYLAVLFRRIPVFTAGLAIYLVFMSFNSVIFKQYMPWFCAFLGLALMEVDNLIRRGVKN